MNVLFDLIKEKKKEFIFTAILASLGAILAVVPYLLIYYIIRLFLENGMAVQMTPVLEMLAAALAAVVLRYIFVVSSFVFSHIAAFDLLYIIRTKLTKHIGKLPMGFWSNNSSGRVRKIIHEDVERIENFVAHHVPDVISGAVLPLCTITVLFFVDWRMALATLIPLPLGFIMVKLMYSGFGTGGKDRNDMWETYHKSIEAMHSSIVEFVQGMPVVKAFNVTTDSFSRLKTSVLDYKDFTIRLSKTQTPYYAAFTAITLGGGLFILPVGIYLLKTGQTDVATFLLFLILGTGCFSQFVKVMTIAGHCEMIFEAGNRIGSILEEEVLTEPEVPQVPENHDVEIKDLSFKYDSNGPTVLSNINVKIPESSFTAIVGESGSGKSTLVHLMARMWDVSEGGIYIGGKNIKEMGTAGINKNVGMVFQEVQMLTDTVRANICMNKKDMKQEEVEEAAKTAYCHEFIQSLPDGYDTVIGEGGDVHLSGGEKQRIALARVILKNPPIILMDEASSYSDAENEVKIQQAFSNVMKNKTVVVIAHRLSTIVHADNILVIDDGKIVEQGTHEDLVQKEEVYTKMWMAHTKARDWKLEDQKAEVTI